MNLQGTSLIADARGLAGGRRFRAVNPALGTALEPEFFEASEAEVARAMEAAAVAFDDYRNRSAAERAGFLERIAAGIEGLGDALIERANAETGLPVARLAGERGRTCGQLRLFAQVVREGSWVDARIDTASAGPPAAAAPRHPPHAHGVSAPSSCSVPAISRWRSRRLAAIRLRHWQQAARWS